MSTIKRWHKWLAAAVGLQLIVWLSSGLYLSLMNKDLASGRLHYDYSEPTVIDSTSLINIKKLWAKNAPVVEVELVHRLGAPYYLLTYEKGLYRHFLHKYQLVNAKTGDFTIVNQALAEAIAKHSYTGEGQISEIELLGGNVADFPKERNPLWRVEFDDDVNTRVYVEADSGRLIGHSNSHKRLADLMLMLHFMDYTRTGSFNNWQMLVFALATLLLMVTGYSRLRR
ncbi:hypothetical protein ACFSJY_05470 [Thalassotalea euphylliae]|uniref:hypothetical protein n=1 Tax=Thalassotalea euphylliae TaxID=1655234 RepID=UPI0036408B34